MIRILETTPRKVSGQTSFVLKFDYNEKVVEVLREIPGHSYDKNTHIWEIPINSLSQTLDDLIRLDDIELKLMDDKTSPNSSFYSESDKIPRPLPENANLVSKNWPHDYLSQSEIDQFRVLPYKHQLEAINFGLTHDKFLLLDGCGLGKTAELIWLAETLKRRGLIEHCFIIAAVNSTKQNWKKEIARFSTESCRILGEKITRTGSIRYATIPERAAELKGDIEEFFVITNIETIRDKTIVDAFNKSKTKFNMIAVDEVHKCASSKSEQSHNLLKLKADYKVAMTGTLITNSALSAYVPLKWTENEHANLTMYKGMYCKFGGFNNSQIVGYQNLDVLRDEIDACSIRRTLDQVRDSIPPKQIDFELVEMDDDQVKFYDAVKRGVQEEADKIVLNHANLLALTTRLRQATSCPELLTSQKVSTAKLDRCCDLVHEIVESGEKVVVFSVFKQPVYALESLLKEFNPLVCTGDTTEAEVSESVDKFQNDPNSKVFIGTVAKVGTGLTLNASMYLIFIDIPWTWSEFDQAYSRIYRVNNTRPAFIRVLGCKNTIDERVWEAVNDKKLTGDYLVDGTDADGTFTKKLQDIITCL